MASTSFYFDPTALCDSISLAHDLQGVTDWRTINDEQSALMGFFKTYSTVIGEFDAGDTNKISGSSEDLNAYSHHFAGERPFGQLNPSGLGIASVCKPQSPFQLPGTATSMQTPGSQACAAVSFDARHGQNGSLECYKAIDNARQPILRLQLSGVISLVMQESDEMHKEFTLLGAVRTMLRQRQSAQKKRVQGSIIVPMLSIPRRTAKLDWLTGLTGYQRDQPLCTIEQAVQFSELRLDENGVGLPASRRVTAQPDATPQYVLAAPFVGCFTLGLPGHPELPIGMFYADQSAWRPLNRSGS